MGPLSEHEAMVRRPPHPKRGSVRASVLGVAMALSLGACGGTSNPFTRAASPAAGDTSRPSLPNEILREEILRRGSSDATAHALIRRLRPTWLVARGQTSLTNPDSGFPIVYIDAVRHGGVFTLHRISSSEIQRLEFIGTADATTRWGTGHPSGVINVVTGR